MPVQTCFSNEISAKSNKITFKSMEYQDGRVIITFHYFYSYYDGPIPRYPTGDIQVFPSHATSFCSIHSLFLCSLILLKDKIQTQVNHQKVSIRDFQLDLPFDFEITPQIP